MEKFDKPLTRILLAILFSISFLIVKSSYFEKYSLPTNSSKKVRQVVSLNVESPFTDQYGYYSLEDTGNSINDYIERLPLSFSYQDKSILVRAPYLTYTSEANRYYVGTIVDTKEGTSYLPSIDTWSLAYNEQPYITSTSDIKLMGYYGDTYVNDLSISLSGNSACTSNKYYLHNLRINMTLPSNITSIRLKVINLHYTNSYHETSSSQDYYVDLGSDTKSLTLNKKTNPGGRSSTVNIQFNFSSLITNYPHYSFVNGSFSWSDIRCNVISGSVTSQNYQTGIFVCSFTLMGVNNKYPYNIDASVSISRPAGKYYDKTVITTNIDRGNVINAQINISLGVIYYFPSYLLDVVNCSGRGDIGDRNMVINVWPSLESYFLALPSEYQVAFSNGTLDDPYLLEALARYDYCVFYKNYGLNDFASRSNNVNKFYSTSKNHVNIVNNEENNIIIIVSSLVAIISISVLSILLVKKRFNHSK